MGHRKFSDIVGEIDSDRRARIDALKQEARADAVAFNLAELRRHRELTQVELARRLERAQASISAMESADDNLLSTWRSVVESMGGRLEIVAVFDDERIAIPTGDPI
ncbi:MAG: transcriptional regulator [Acidimicrobiales bacterium]